MYPPPNCTDNKIMNKAYKLHLLYSNALKEYAEWLESGDNYPFPGPVRYMNKDKVGLCQIIKSIIESLQNIEAAPDGWGQDPDPYKLRDRYPDLDDLIGNEYINWQQFANFLFDRDYYDSGGNRIQINTYEGIEIKLKILEEELDALRELPFFEELEGEINFLCEIYRNRNGFHYKVLNYEARVLLLINYFKTVEFKEAYDKLKIESKIYWVNKLFADLSGSCYGREFILRSLKFDKRFMEPEEYPEVFFTRYELESFVCFIKDIEPDSDYGLDLYIEDFASLCSILLPYTFGGKEFWHPEVVNDAVNIRKLLDEGIKEGLKFIDPDIYVGFNKVLLEKEPALINLYEETTDTFHATAYATDFIFYGKLAQASIAHLGDLIETPDTAFSKYPCHIQALKIAKISFSIVDIGISGANFRKNPNIRNAIGLSAAIHAGVDVLDDSLNFIKRLGAKLAMKWGTVFFGGCGVFFSMIDAIKSENIGVGFGHILGATASLVGCLTAVLKIQVISGATSAAGAAVIGSTIPVYGWIALGLLVAGLILVYIFTEDPMEEWIRRNFFGKNWQGQNINNPTQIQFLFEDEFPRQIIKHNSIIRPLNLSTDRDYFPPEGFITVNVSFDEPKVLEKFLNICFYFYWKYGNLTFTHTSIITIYPTVPGNSMEEFRQGNIEYIYNEKEIDGTYEYKLELEIEDGKVDSIKKFECKFDIPIEAVTLPPDGRLWGFTEAHVSYAKEGVYLFSWDNVPGTDSERLLRFLTDDIDIGWAENAEILKSDDGKTIRIFKDENSAEIIINETEGKATLKISDGRTHDLKVKRDNDKLKIYEGVMNLFQAPGSYLIEAAEQ